MINPLTSTVPPAALLQAFTALAFQVHRLPGSELRALPRRGVSLLAPLAGALRGLTRNAMQELLTEVNGLVSHNEQLLKSASRLVNFHQA